MSALPAKLSHLLAVLGSFSAGLLVSSVTNGGPPTLKHVFPGGGQRGQSTVITCTGDFSWPVHIWAPGLDATVAEQKGKLEISIPPDLAADRVWIRLYDEQGSSAPVPFLIGSLPELEEREPNDRLDEAQIVEVDGAVCNGLLNKRGDVDAYSVELAEGQTLVASVDANTRLGSPMDAILQLVTPQGIVLSQNHDAVGLDPRIVYTANKAGRHIIRVFAFPSQPDSTIAFRGGNDYIYRMTLTTGAYVTHAFPFYVFGNDTERVEYVGWNFPAGLRLPIVPRAGEAFDELRAATTGRPHFVSESVGGLAFGSCVGGSARLRLVAGKSLDRDPARVAPSCSDALTPPISRSGRLAAPGQTDTYRVFLRQGQQVSMAVEAPSLHLPLVPVVRLEDPNGQVVVDYAAGGPAADAIITHQAACEGTYRLSIRDRYHHGGQRYYYQLTIGNAEPDFHLQAEADSLTIRPNDVTDFPIAITRRAVAESAVGDIQILVDELPDGVTVDAAVSHSEGPTSEKVILRFQSCGVAYSGPVRIRGIATEPRRIERVASLPPRLGARLSTVWLTAIAESSESR